MVEDLRPKWGWLLALGVGLIILGAIALVAPWLTTLTSVVVFGWMVFLGGAFEIAAAFGTKGWSGILLHVLSGILGLVVGAMLFRHPGAGALGLTLLLASLFLVGGLSASARPPTSASRAGAGRSRAGSSPWPWASSSGPSGRCRRCG